MTDFERTNFQEHIHKMNERELELLTYDIRDFLISSVAKTGGHLASNLGVVELTVALHRAFDVCRDKIVWDVGHQAYVHKILTGRAADFATLRSFGGLSGFPKTCEHASDVYNSGHASSSISAAMGLAESRTLRGEDFHVVSVIGDGALTGGLAYEGLANVGARGTKMLVVLNDNEMSISPNTSSVAAHLSRLRSSQAYQQAKQQIKESMRRIPKVGKGALRRAERIKELLRHAVVDGSVFEDLGFTYFGPVDGHDVREMVELFEAVKLLDGPVLVHVVTKKGKGYRNAEKNPDLFHGVGPFDPLTGKELTEGGQTWSSVAGGTACALAEEDARVCAISAAMTDAVGLGPFAKRFPQRFYDVGIAEGHAATFAAGLALGGLRPFVFIYSTFLQRAYDEMLMDVCAQGLPVVFMIDRAGNVGRDGETHHGVFDLSYLSSMPGMTVMAPKDGAELSEMMRFALTVEGPCAIRYPRGAVGMDFGQTSALATGRPERLSGGTLVEIRAVGKMAAQAIEAARILEEAGVSCGVVNERFVQPLCADGADGLLTAGARCRLLVTLEDNVLAGGFGEAVAALLAAAKPSSAAVPHLLCLGWPDAFLPQGDVEELFSAYGLDATGIAGRIAVRLSELGYAG